MGDKVLVIARKIMHIMPKVFHPCFRQVYHHVMRIKLIREFFVKAYSLEGCYEYWRNPPIGGNSPQAYLVDGESSSMFLLGLINKYMKRDGNILEIGCNVGRNLNHLYLNGYRRLEGIEISIDALDLLSKTYPALSQECRLYNVPVENVINSMSDKKYNAVFTMAVLEHIHPDSEWIFEHITRITKDVIITIEDELSVSAHTFPRNYKKVFEQIGMVQVEEINCKDVHSLSGSFRARVFVHDDGKLS